MPKASESGARPDRPDSPGVVEPEAAKADMKYRRLSELVGLTIKNDQGEELGELEDIVIDTHEGKVAYAVLSMRSGFLGSEQGTGRDSMVVVRDPSAVGHGPAERRQGDAPGDRVRRG